MKGAIFNFNKGDLIFRTSDDKGMDSNGDLYTRTGDNMAMNLNTGELHITSSWSSDDDED